jgi:hypothetical protein
VTSHAALIVTNIAAGCTANHSLFVTSDGTLWWMGQNQDGELGIGNLNNTNRPQQILAGGVTAMAAGEFHTLFVINGGLWGMGENGSGQLGAGTLLDTTLPVGVVAGGVTAVAAGDVHSLFLKSDGSLWGMGRNLEGELGDGFDDAQPPNGTVWPEQIWPRPRPVLAQTVSANTNLQFTATCEFGGNFYLLAGTNITQPLDQWTPVWTNIRYRWYNIFSATVTNAVNSGNQQFYILQSQ